MDDLFDDFMFARMVGDEEEDALFDAMGARAIFGDNKLLRQAYLLSFANDDLDDDDDF